MTLAQVFDMGAALALAFFVVRGAMRGLTGEIISLLGLIASVLCSWTFAQPMGALVLNHFPAWNSAITELVCAAAIFIGVSLAFSVLNRIMRTLVRAANLTFLDHFMGAISGALRAFVVVLFIYGVMSIISPAVPSDWMEDSMAMQGASAVWPTILQIMTDSGWIDPSRFMS